MRVLFSAVLLAAFAALSIPASANPQSDMLAIWTAWAGVDSYHIVVTPPDGSATACDMMKSKMHCTTPQAEIIKIGGDVWVNHGGSWMHVPSMMMGRVNSMTGRMVPGALTTDKRDDYTITFVGVEKLNGVSARHYRMTNKTNGDVNDIWAGPGNLPLQMQTHEDGGVTTMVFSNYNKVADITPPAM